MQRLGERGLAAKDGERPQRIVPRHSDIFLDQDNRSSPLIGRLIE
jgi:hypothetical protein